MFLQHLLPDRAYEDHYQQLMSIISKILQRCSGDFADLFAHDKFMPFIDMFQKESVKVGGPIVTDTEKLAHTRLPSVGFQS